MFQTPGKSVPLPPHLRSPTITYNPPVRNSPPVETVKPPVSTTPVSLTPKKPSIMKLPMKIDVPVIQPLSVSESSEESEESEEEPVNQGFFGRFRTVEPSTEESEEEEEETSSEEDDHVRPKSVPYHPQHPSTVYVQMDKFQRLSQESSADEESSEEELPVIQNEPDRGAEVMTATTHITTRTSTPIQREPIRHQVKRSARYEPNLDMRFLLQKQTGSGEIVYDLTRRARESQVTIFKMLRFRDERGVDEEGVRYFAWMPNASANHLGRPAKGYFMTINEPKRVPADPNLFEKDKFCWGTLCFRVPFEWESDSGQSLYDMWNTDRRRIHDALEQVSQENPNLNHSSAFVGLYASNRREVGWKPELWFVVQCNNLSMSRNLFDTIRTSFARKKEVDKARDRLKRNVGTAKDKALLETIAKSRTHGQSSWEQCFGPSCPFAKVRTSSELARREVVEAFFARLGFSRVRKGLLNKKVLPCMVETVQNFVRFLPKQSTWAYYNGCTSVFTETRAMILHERPYYGIVLLTGVPDDSHPLGALWGMPVAHQVLQGAFPCSTGRIRNCSQSIRENGERIATQGAFFCGGECPADNGRLLSDTYRSRTDEWINLEYIMGRPQLGGEIHLKPLMVRCAETTKESHGKLLDLIG